MSKNRRVKPMFSLSPVEFRDSPIAGRGVFARRPFRTGDVVVPYAPRQRKVDARDPEAVAAAETKLTLLSEQRFVIIPDTSVPGGWLCNHSCHPNAAIFSDREGRVQCTRPIAPGDEVTIFYGWVSHNEPERDPCRCAAPPRLHQLRSQRRRRRARSCRRGPSRDDGRRPREAAGRIRRVLALDRPGASSGGHRQYPRADEASKERKRRLRLLTLLRRVDSDSSDTVCAM